MPTSLDPSDNVRIDEDKGVTETSTTTSEEEEEEQNNSSSTTVIPTGPVVPPAGNFNEDCRLMLPPVYDGMPPPSNIGAKLDKEENVVDEDKSSPVPCNVPVFMKLQGFIQNSNSNTIPFTPKKDRKRILSEKQRKRNKLHAVEIRTERLSQQNTALEAEIKRYKAMAMLIATMYSQVEKSKDSNQCLNKKLREKELQLFFLKRQIWRKTMSWKVLRKKSSRGC
jgi:hypothetical protein